MYDDGFFQHFPAADVDNSVSRAVYWGCRATNRGGLTACGSSARGRRLASVLWEKEGKTVIFGKYINRYYLRHAPTLLLGILSLLMVDYIQLLVPQLYRLVINGVNLGQVVVKGETMPFTREVLFQHICLPMIWIVLFMVVGRFLWRICFFGTSIRVQADLRERMFDHSRRLSQQYYQVNKVGNLMSLYTNDLDTIQECFGDGILMFFDALVLGLLALYKMWRMDTRLTLLALIPAAFMFAIGTVMGKTMTRTWEKRQQAFSDLSDFAQENFSGIAVIKAFVKELKELIAFRKLNKENEEVNVEYTRISVLLEVMVTFYVESVVCVILGYGGFLVYKGDFNAGQLVEYIGYFEAIVWPIMAISMLIEKTSRGKASLNRITELLDAPIDVADRDGVPDLESPKGGIEFRGLTFRYPDGEFDVLKDISFTVAPGERAWASWARPARARRRWWTCFSAPTMCPTAPSLWMERTSTASPSVRCGRPAPMSRKTTSSSRIPSPTTLPSAWTKPPRRTSSGRPVSLMSGTTSWISRTAMRPFSASAASPSRAARSSASPSPVLC